jgi:hypothetical protein
MSKTISIRMERDNYGFLHEITKEGRNDLSRGNGPSKPKCHADGQK